MSNQKDLDNKKPLFQRCAQWFARSWKVVLPVTLFIMALYWREKLHPVLFQAREYWMLGLLSLIILIATTVLVVWLFRRSETRARILIFATGVLFILSCIYFRMDQTLLQAFDYAEKHHVYKDELKLVWLEQSPQTQNERVYPLNLVKQRISNEKLSSSLEISEPDEIRVGDKNYWSMAVQPKQDSWLRWYQNITNVRFIDVTALSLKASEDMSFETNFVVGETLVGSRNTMTAVIRNFNPWMYFNYKPANIKFLLNDDNIPVQVVTLIRVRGGLYAHPEFGGVYIIEQSEETGLLNKIGRSIRRWLMGTGRYVSPEEIRSGKYKYLLKQNLRPYEHSRYIAESFRFKGGIGTVVTHEEDIKIPDISEHLNPLPHVSDNHFAGTGVEIGHAMTHFMPIEPWDPEKSTLLYSLYIPADGISEEIYAVDHLALGHEYFGITEVTAKIFDSRKEITQEGYTAIEHVDCNRDVISPTGDTIRKKYWLSTVVTRDLKDTTGQTYNASVPDKTLIDAEMGTVTWIPQDKLGEWETFIPGLLRTGAGDTHFVETQLLTTDSAGSQSDSLLTAISDSLLIETSLSSPIDSIQLLDSLIQLEEQKSIELSRQTLLETKKRKLDSIRQANKGSEATPP